MDNGHARKRVEGVVRGAGANSGVVCGWTGVSVGEADAGDVSKGEEVGLGRAHPTGDGGRTKRAVTRDAPPVQGSRSIVLDEWDGGKDGVSD
jgi:hypothetical protein